MPRPVSPASRSVSPASHSAARLFPSPLLALALCAATAVSSPARAATDWPEDEQWLAFRQAGVDMVDPAQDQVDSSEVTDLVGAAGSPVAAWYADGSTVYLRLRLNQYPYAAASLLELRGWAVLFETDGDQTNYEMTLGATGPVEMGYFFENTDVEGGLEDPADSLVDFWPWTDGIGRVVGADTSTDDDADWFLDLQIPRADLADVALLSPIDTTTRFRMLAGSSTTADVQIIESDIAGHNDSGGLGVLVDGWTDLVAIDADEDGLTMPQEAEYGTDPDDGDSDEDGLSDGEEVLGFGTDPMDCDSDDDGLSDGLELGRTEPHPDTDTSSDCWTPDTDPKSTTDPLDGDDDGDGILDGDEDADGDGAVDEWETDPEVDDSTDSDGDGIPDVLEDRCGGDGADSDGDGFADGLEGLVDTDLDGDPDFCDPDDDGDGISSSVEGGAEAGADGGVDTDGDKTPDHLDLDTDADKKPDVDEGTEDIDCDGIGNWRDADDEDGPCADPDHDGLTNAEEAECETDPYDPDTDDDGILDGDESCEDDEDGDGIPDVRDPDHSGDGGGQGGGDDTAGLPPFSGGHFTGGSCSSSPTGAALLPGAIALGLLARRRRRRAGAGQALSAGLVGLSAAGLLSSPAAAQEVDAQRFNPTVDGRAFIGLHDSEVGRNGLGGGLFFNYAEDPFIYRYDDDRADEEILGEIGTANLLLFANLQPVRLGLDLPLHLLRSGYGIEGFEPLGDLGVDAKWEILDRRRAPLGLALDARLDLPTGDGRDWLGEPGLQAGGQAVVTYGPSWVAAANLGLSGGGSSALDDIDWGSRMHWGAGFSLPLPVEFMPLWTMAELDGEVLLGSAGAPGGAPAEARLGLRAEPLPQLLASLGGGAGIGTGIGAPDFRLFAGLTWVPALDGEAAPVSLGADPDGDGIGAPQDLCPEQAEDFNGQNDEDGCPDAGRTRTSIEVVEQGGNTPVAGAVVELVGGPEVHRWTAAGGEIVYALPPGTYQMNVSAEGYTPLASGLEVPSAISYESRVQLQANVMGLLQVSVVDEQGRPLAAEGRLMLPGSTRQVALTVGSDGLARQEVPVGTWQLYVTSPGHGPGRRTVEVRRNGTAEIEVVLRAPRTEVSGGQIRIMDKVFFKLDSDELDLRSVQILDEVAGVMATDSSIARLEIQGHTDAQGSEEHNRDLSQRRAESVRRYLVDQGGIAPDRLVARGFGESQLLQAGDSEDVHATNRRVEFHIIDGAAPSSLPR